MMAAVMNLVLLLLGLAAVIFWIVALVTSDGECDTNLCGNCPYAGGCPHEKNGNGKEEEDT